MKINSMFLALVLIAGCSPDGAEISEPPFYNVDRNGTGPLTLQELQINIPGELAAYYTDGGNCLISKIEELAAQAGDPQTLDPSTVELLSDIEDWQKLNRSTKRIILAQVIVSNAGRACS
jgi:hypothetical protein|tara:strand:+ start:1168 stop:1527 length:360 start_codon:yes stop_codon:yes gene_type:complete